MLPCCANNACELCAKEAYEVAGKCPVKDCGDEEVSVEDLIPNRMVRKKAQSYRDKHGIPLQVRKKPPQAAAAAAAGTGVPVEANSAVLAIMKTITTDPRLLLKPAEEKPSVAEVTKEDVTDEAPEETEEGPRELTMLEEVELMLKEKNARKAEEERQAAEEASLITSPPRDLAAQQAPSSPLIKDGEDKSKDISRPDEEEEKRKSISKEEEHLESVSPLPGNVEEKEEPVPEDKKQASVAEAVSPSHPEKKEIEEKDEAKRSNTGEKDTAVPTPTKDATASSPPPKETANTISRLESATIPTIVGSHNVEIPRELLSEAEQDPLAAFNKLMQAKDKEKGIDASQYYSQIPTVHTSDVASYHHHHGGHYQQQHYSSSRGHHHPHQYPHHGSYYGQKLCHNCNEPGHFAAQCKYLKSYGSYSGYHHRGHPPPHIGGGSMERNMTYYYPPPPSSSSMRRTRSRSRERSHSLRRSRSRELKSPSREKAPPPALERESSRPKSSDRVRSASREKKRSRSRERRSRSRGRRSRSRSEIKTAKKRSKSRERRSRSRDRRSRSRDRRRSRSRDRQLRKAAKRARSRDRKQRSRSRERKRSRSKEKSHKEKKHKKEKKKKNRSRSRERHKGRKSDAEKENKNENVTSEGSSGGRETAKEDPVQNTEAVNTAKSDSNVAAGDTEGCATDHASNSGIINKVPEGSSSPKQSLVEYSTDASGKGNNELEDISDHAEESELEDQKKKASLDAGGDCTERSLIPSQDEKSSSDDEAQRPRSRKSSSSSKRTERRSRSKDRDHRDRRRNPSASESPDLGGKRTANSEKSVSPPPVQSDVTSGEASKNEDVGGCSNKGWKALDAESLTATPETLKREPSKEKMVTKSFTPLLSKTPPKIAIKLTGSKVIATAAAPPPLAHENKIDIQLKPSQDLLQEPEKALTQASGSVAPEMGPKPDPPCSDAPGWAGDNLRDLQVKPENGNEGTVLKEESMDEEAFKADVKDVVDSQEVVKEEENNTAIGAVGKEEKDYQVRRQKSLE